MNNLTIPPVVTEFKDFIVDANVVGLGIGALVANNTMDIGKAITDSIVMPLVNGAVTQTVPDVSFYSLLQSLITFMVTMLVVFVLLKIFNIKTIKPVSWVHVVADDTKRS
jgi:large-conductance mechanosensitive channel